MDNPPTLLQLPISIRVQIHRFCGLIRPCPVSLNFEGVRQRWIAIDLATHYRFTPQGDSRCLYLQKRSEKGKRFEDGLPPGLECFSPPIPFSLLLLSHSFHDEVVCMLYGKNQFKINRLEHDLRDHPLRALRTLSHKALRVIESLHVGLTDIEDVWFSSSLSIERLDSKSVHGSQYIQKWAALCEDTLSQIPAHGKFSLSCNASDTKTALQITRPLERIQPMSEASICLSADPNQKAIMEIARKVALQVTAKSNESHNSQTFRLSWNDLPKEIRLDFLSRTELVGHYYWLNWSQNKGFEIEAGALLPRAGVCCANCTSTLSVCTCHTIHAAISTTCTCPGVPSALFRVSKLMSAETAEVFFSQNRFILSGDFAANRSFLFNLPPAVLQHLRTVDLQLSFKQLYDMRKQDSQKARDWEALVALIASLLQLPKVWLSVDITQTLHTMMSLNNQGDHDYAWLRTSYAKLFDPLHQHLKGAGLRKFHVYLGWWLDYELAAEREVMGPDYDSCAEGSMSVRERHPRYPHIEGK